MSRSEKIEQIIIKMEDVKDIWEKLGEDKIAQEIMGEIGVGCYTSEAVYRGIINKLKGYKEEEEKEMSKDTQMGYANIVNEIADTIGQAEQINKRMWREEAITHDRKRYFITYEFTDEEITEAKACDDPAQFEEFLPFDERHVYEVEEI